MYFNRDHRVTSEDIRKMTDSMVHRGPDDDGVYLDGSVGLGFRRLSIIDVSGGHQPLSNERGNIWIVFNGEIYNYLALHDDLVKKGHHFTTKSDTEVIVHLYEEYGESCVTKLRGMFAFSIWDAEKQQLFCARDRFGIKPFFYFADNQRFLWGSEIKAIMAAEAFNKQLNLEALNEYLTYGYTAADHCIFEGIRKLPPAHTITINASRPADIRIKPYWSIHFEPDYSISEKDWIEQMQSLLAESVKMRLMSEVPLGAFLSGGIDSSSVVALMARNSEQQIKTFSIGFKDDPNNELDYARLVSKMYNTEHYERILEPSSVSVLPELVSAYDEPFADSSSIPTFFLSKFAREHVTVALSGDGGDELFAGYDHYKRFLKIHKYNRAFSGINRLVFRKLLDLTKDDIRGKKILYLLSLPRETAYAYSGIWHSYERKKLLNQDTWKTTTLNNPEEFRNSILGESLKESDFLSAIQRLDLLTYLPDDILRKVDRASMKNSLEVRVPLLDHKLAELSFRIPSGLKMHKNQTKYIFRNAVRDILPPEVLNHKKQGFVIPITSWFRKDLTEYIQDILNKRNSVFSTYFNPDYIEEIKQIHLSGGRDFNSKIWSLIFFDAWHKHHFPS